MKRTPLTDAERASILPQVKRCVLFTDLNETQLESVLQHSRIVELQEAEHLFEQQQPAHEFFLLDQGQVKLARCSPEGHEKIIDLVSSGGTFAEAIMFAKQPIYPVTATAIMPSRVICFDGKAYTDILHESTDACFAIMAAMSRRLHGHVAEIDRLTLHSATFRVICYLLEQLPSTQLGSSEVKLDTPKHVIAARLSITPETLSRSFSKLSREGLIKVQDNAVTLNDVSKLRRFAQGEPL